MSTQKRNIQCNFNAILNWPRLESNQHHDQNNTKYWKEICLNGNGYSWIFSTLPSDHIDKTFQVFINTFPKSISSKKLYTNAKIPTCSACLKIASESIIKDILTSYAKDTRTAVKSFQILPFYGTSLSSSSSVVFPEYLFFAPWQNFSKKNNCVQVFCIPTLSRETVEYLKNVYPSFLFVQTYTRDNRDFLQSESRSFINLVRSKVQQTKPFVVKDKFENYEWKHFRIAHDAHYWKTVNAMDGEFC